MTIVVDASVALKWYLAEEDWETARGILAGADQITAPELVVVEVSNAAWKAYRRGLIAAEQQALIAADVVQVFDRLEPLSHLSVRASAIAREIDHPVYDCFYLALSEAKDAPIGDQRRTAAREDQRNRVCGPHDQPACLQTIRALGRCDRARGGKPCRSCARSPAACCFRRARSRCRTARCWWSRSRAAA